MADTKKHLEELAHFIREHRSSESNFETLYKRLTEEAKYVQGSNEGLNDYSDALREIAEKHADVYRQHKEKNISTWTEFENFVSHFEKAVTEAIKAI